MTSIPQKLSGYLLANAGIKQILVMVPLQVAFFFFLFPFLADRFGPGDFMQPLDLMFGFTACEAFSHLQQLGDQGRKGYLITLVFADTLYPLVYSTLLALIISAGIKRMNTSKPNWKVINLIPYFAAYFDLLENAGIMAMLISFPDKTSLAAWLASVAGMLKWSFVAISVLVAAGGIVRLLFFNKK
ncbi:MAG TPA: hypothetical protein VLH37_01160 [Bacteroidales bacterium]|nr:hypothetical protein [Bacteroidales bacterium]